MYFLWRNRLKILYQLGSRYMVRKAGLVNVLVVGWGEPRQLNQTRSHDQLNSPTPQAQNGSSLYLMVGFSSLALNPPNR
jgi:hypothetical protein